jgi:hypothetical protein
VKKDEKSILPRCFGSKSKLMTELTHLAHLTINPCECQFSATAFQHLTRFTNLRQAFLFLFFALRSSSPPFFFALPSSFFVLCPDSAKTTSTGRWEWMAWIV